MPGSALWVQGFWAAALPTSLPRPAAMPPIHIERRSSFDFGLNGLPHEIDLAFDDMHGQF
jgi:hypothetical protein